MKKIVISIFLLSFINAFSQEKKSLYIKGNVLLAPIGVLNIGVEKQLSDQFTLQGDILISPWKSINGNHAQVYMGIVEGRYYFNEAFKHWYVGLNGGSSIFNLTKLQYSGLHEYQKGFNFLLGGTVGYQFHWKEKWNIDIFAGAGTVQSFYRGYTELPTGTVRNDRARRLNKSGELLPYRGGIMIAYRLK